MRKKNLIVSGLLIAFILIAGCRGGEVPLELSAALSELSGFVGAKQAGEDSFNQASDNFILQVNGQIQTGDDGRVRLDLSSGTIIRLAPSTLFTLIENDEVEGGLATRIQLEVGKIFIILNGGSADVETPSGVASVRGSYMKVEVDPETFDIYITCLEGNCSASNPAGTVNFSDGEKVVLFHQDPVTGNWTAPNVEPMTLEEFQEWLDENPEARELFNQAMATITAMAQPTATATSTPTPEPTATLQQAGTPADASSACFSLTQPNPGASLPLQGQVTFGWESQSGASRYVITFYDPNGTRITIGTTSTSTTFFIEVLPAGGTYEWFVTAFGSDGSEICSTDSSTFSKPQAEPTPRPTRVPDTEPEPICDPCDLNGSCAYEYYEWLDFCTSGCEPEDFCNPESSCYNEDFCE
jgi:hypothetical protein